MVLSGVLHGSKDYKTRSFFSSNGFAMLPWSSSGSMTFQNISWTSETFCKVLVEPEDS